MTEQSHDYRTRIQSGPYHLSPAYRIVCDYLLREYVVAAMSTAAEVAAAANVDTTTVVRCAQALGYSGWPELQAQLKAHALEEFRNNNGAGVVNYTDALHAWLRYSGLRSISAQNPADTTTAASAARAFAEAIRLTDYCLSDELSLADYALALTQ